MFRLAKTRARFLLVKKKKKKLTEQTTDFWTTFEAEHDQLQLFSKNNA